MSYTSRIVETDIISACRAEVKGSIPLCGAEWVAGLLEGEGSFVLKEGKKPRVTCHMTDLDVLERLQNYAGGRIYKVKNPNPHKWKQSWVWTITDSDKVVVLMKDILPYMCSRRTEKILHLLDCYEQHLQAKNKKNIDREKRNKRIIQKYNEGLTVTKIAELENVSRQTASAVVNKNARSSSLV